MILISTYSHPEAYPPMLNAIECLSKLEQDIVLMYNNVLVTAWGYPPNLRLDPIGEYIPIREFEKKTTIFKAWRWIIYTVQLRKNLKHASLFLAYDPIPLFSYHVASFLLRKRPKIVWYHNHDIVKIQNTRKYSIGWFAAKSEGKIIAKFDVFSLPAIERKKYFSLKNFKGSFFFLPNYPLKSFYNKFSAIKKEENCVKLLFQGSIGEGHGIEQLCSMLPFNVNGKPIKLVLKGFVSDAYKKSVLAILAKRAATQFVDFVGVTPYQDVPVLAATCHIGIAVFTKQDAMNKTLGTASNKIYEYAACGLPVLYYENEHFKQHLGQYAWAMSTDLSSQSFISAIQFIDDNYQVLSKSAIEAFTKELNFEKYFAPIEAHLLELNADK